jgi:hypothetical protein
MATTGPEDPGWKPNFKVMLLHHLMPWKVMSGGRAASHPLTTLRSVYLSLLSAGPLLLLVLSYITPFGEPALGLAAALAVLGVACLAASRWAWNRDIKIGSRDEIRQSFQANFFLAFALAEITLLASFTACFVVDGWWPFLIGLAVFLIGMARIAPTRGHLEAKNDELRVRGSRYLLTEALSTPPETGQA